MSGDGVGGGRVVTIAVGTIVEEMVVEGDAVLEPSCSALLSASGSGEGNVGIMVSSPWSDDESVASGIVVRVVFVTDSSPGVTDVATLAVVSCWGTGVVEV